MALVQLDPYDQPTRALNGTVIYRNGPVQTAMRSRSYPTVPKHLTRNPALNAITILSERWELLSNAQRIGWANYAYASPLTDAWGNDRYVRGYAHYMRSNRPRLVTSLPIIDDPPTDAGFPPYTSPTAAFSTLANELQMTWPISDDWTQESGAFLFLWISRPTTAAITRPPETYTFLGLESGFPGRTTNFAEFVSFEKPTPPLARVWIRTAVTRADGRYTSQ